VTLYIRWVLKKHPEYFGAIFYRGKALLLAVKGIIRPWGTKG
jgi:hypothetical protein